jgi:hypothetical protein
VVEGTSLLRKHTGLNLYRGFDSLRLRQKTKPRTRGVFAFGAGRLPTHTCGAVLQRLLHYCKYALALETSGSSSVPVAPLSRRVLTMAL